MSINTSGLDLEGSFNVWLRQCVVATQGLINAYLQTTYNIAYYPNIIPESHPSVQSYCFLGGGFERHRKSDQIQVDIRTQGPSDAERRRLMLLIRDNLSEQMGLRKRRSSYVTHFDVKGYAKSPVTPSWKHNARVELLSSAGWGEIPDDSPTILRVSNEFKILYI